MRVVVVAGMARLSAARAIAKVGHSVQVLDKGRRVSGRLATKQLGGGANADYGAQFFTARSSVKPTARAAQFGGRWGGSALMGLDLSHGWRLVLLPHRFGLKIWRRTVRPIRDPNL